MGSSATRYEIVTEALTRAGQDVSLRELSETMLNRMLRKWSLEYKYPILRKIGDVQTLSAGSSSLALPLDYGAGIDSLLLGTERSPLYERSPDEFLQFNGLSGATGRPQFYMVDQEAGLVLFNLISAEAYPVQMVYYKAPADIAVNDSAGDDQTVWMPDDELAIQGLIQMIYQYANDDREGVQSEIVKSLKGDYRRGSVPMGGGVNKILLSPRAFKRNRG